MLLKNDYTKVLLLFLVPVIIFISVRQYEHLNQVPSLPTRDLFSSVLRRDHNKITSFYVSEIPYNKLFSQCLSAQFYYRTPSFH